MKYYASQFDLETFVVCDETRNREFCVCGNFDDDEDAEDRANKIAAALNYITAEPQDAYDAKLKCRELFFPEG